MYREGLITIPALISDAKRAIQSGALFSGLCTAFALADECATKEWNKNHNNKRKFADDKAYSEWYEAWGTVRNHNERRDNNGKAPQIDGQLLYKLRCNIVHAMSSNVDFSDMSDDANRNIVCIDYLTDYPNEICTVPYTSSYSKRKDNTLSIGIADLANELLRLVNIYYEKNKECVDFNYMKITDFTSLYI